MGRSLAKYCGVLADLDQESQVYSISLNRTIISEHGKWQAQEGDDGRHVKYIESKLRVVPILSDQSATFFSA
jgi:hypothetical protein